jgi:hypothetical protein
LFWKQTRICGRFVNNRAHFAQTGCWETREYGEKLEISCGDCCPNTSAPEGATVAFDRTAFVFFLMIYCYLLSQFFRIPG